MSTEKTDGATKVCESCGTELTCRMFDYSGSYSNKLQWQNEDGSAHYKWVSNEKYDCVDKDGNNIKPKTSETETPKETIQEPPSFPGVNIVPKIKIDYHNNAWEIALMKANKVYENKGALQKDIYILAQVFYKGLMGMQS